MGLPGFVRVVVSTIASVAMASACLPAAVFAGESGTAVDEAAFDAQIQEAIDSLEAMEAGVDYIDDELLVTYSGQEEAQLVELDEGESVLEALEEALDDDAVVAAQPNYRYTLADEDESESGVGTALTSVVSSSLSDDPSLSLQYYLGDWDETFSTVSGSSVASAWALAQTNHKVSVAILDTGVELSHEDLKDNIDAYRMASVSKSGVVKVGADCAIDDEVGHGTHAAGIIAASANNGVGIAGVSYDATIIPVKVFYKEAKYDRHGYPIDVSYSTNTQCVLQAYKYLKGIVGETNLHVINLSLGGYDSDNEDKLLESAIDDMYDLDVLSVCAGGNGSSKGTAYTKEIFPGDYAPCICVTALESNGTNAKWSDYNGKKDISAQGVAIYSCLTKAYASELRESLQETIKELETKLKRAQASPFASEKTIATYQTYIAAYQKELDNTVARKNGSYGYMDGTSMAAPIVSGILALIWSVSDGISAAQAEVALKNTANQVNRAQNYHSKSGSAGAVDAAAAVQYAIDNFAVDYTGPSEGEIAAPATPKTMAVKKLTASTKSVKATWKTSSGAAGYQVRYKVKGGSWKTATIKNSLATSKTVSGLKPNKTYYVQVRSYRFGADQKRLYGAWSASKSAKTK